MIYFGQWLSVTSALHQENIAWGYPSASFAEVRAAAQSALAAEFIEELPEVVRVVVVAGHNLRLSLPKKPGAEKCRVRPQISLRSFGIPSCFLFFDGCLNQFLHVILWKFNETWGEVVASWCIELDSRHTIETKSLSPQFGVEIWDFSWKNDDSTPSFLISIRLDHRGPIHTEFWRNPNVF